MQKSTRVPMCPEAHGIFALFNGPLRKCPELDSGNPSLWWHLHQDPLAQFEALERWSSQHFSTMVTPWEVFCRVSTAFEMSSGSFCVFLPHWPHFLEKVREGLHLHVYSGSVFFASKFRG